MPLVRFECSDSDYHDPLLVVVGGPMPANLNQVTPLCPEEGCQAEMDGEVVK